MKPIQLWLPTFFGGIARPELRRDMQRMFRARTTEHVMWSVPGWSGPPRWAQGQVRVSCLNGEGLECARILHIGDKGAVVGPAAASFPNQSVAGMLDHWLNDDFVRAVPVNSDEPLWIKVPHRVNGGVVLVEAELSVPSEMYFPMTHVGDDRIFAQWPPRLDMPTTVSPEVERVQPLSDARELLRLRFAWLAPFDESQPLLISPDDIYARDKMREIAEASGNDCIKARAQALTEAQGWISEGQASLNEVWLKPIISKEGGEGAVIAIA